MKKRILILCTEISHYRIPLYNELSKFYDLTILHGGGKISSESTLRFDTVYSKDLKLAGFRYQVESFRLVKRGEFDAIISLMDFHCLSNIFAFWIRPRNVKFIFWGAWITKNGFANAVRIRLIKNSDAHIFYDKRTMECFRELGCDPSKLFVANNTVAVAKTKLSIQKKKRILFVGSLNPRKDVPRLLRAFKYSIDIIDHTFILTIIGNGEEKKRILKLIKELELQRSVEVLESINNLERLERYYSESLFAVSLGQAGLSVLQSFGFGVPFVTAFDAISGGEIHNIRHLHNGILCSKNIDCLLDVLLFAINNEDLLVTMGQNAFKDYQNYCSIENYALGFVDAVENTRTSKTRNFYE